MIRDRKHIQSMFGAIAPRYDLLNRLLSAGQDGRWRRRAVGLLSPGLGPVLDLAAGTGDLGLALLRAQPRARILAADCVEAMCRRARDKGLADCVLADALALPFAAESFDGVMTGFGIRNFESVERGLAEMARVLSPGGEILILEFFPSRRALFGALFRFYFGRLLPWIGARISGDAGAYGYLPRSVEDFLTREHFAEALEKAGFGQVRLLELSGGIATAFFAKKQETGGR